MNGSGGGHSNSKIYITALLCAGVIAFACIRWAHLPYLHSYLVGLNSTLMGFFFFDKKRAQAGSSRIPEKVLLVLALAGGTLGAILSMIFFRHKSIKRSFQIKLGVILLVQIFAYLSIFEPETFKKLMDRIFGKGAAN